MTIPLIPLFICTALAAASPTGGAGADPTATEAASDAVEAAEGAMEEATDAASDAVEGATDVATEAADAATEAATDATEAATETATEAADAAADAMSPMDVLTKDGFDADKIIEMIDGSGLTEARKELLKTAVTNAADNPVLMEQALTRVKAALGM